jgi:hypothetical protein
MLGLAEASTSAARFGASALERPGGAQSSAGGMFTNSTSVPRSM